MTFGIECFADEYGEFTRIREQLKAMPEDIRLKRLAGNLLTMAQAGQYNYMRCLKHGEREAAQLACVEFVHAAMKSAFLLHRQYLPYYKWSFHALRLLEQSEAFADELKGLSKQLSRLLSGENSKESVIFQKYDMI